MIFSEITTLFKKKDLIKYFAASELKSLYKSKVLGFSWAILDPFFVMLVYVVLVSVIFKKGGPYFPILLFSSLLPWRWLTYSVTSSVVAFVSNAQLIQTVKFPLSIFPLNAVIIGAVNYMMGMVVLMAMLIFYDISFTWNLLWLLPLFALQFFFIFGISMISSVAGVFLPDLQNILSFVIKIGFYLSPALFSVADIPVKYQEYYLLLNPFASLFENCKNIIVYGAHPDADLLIYIVYSLLLFLTGLVLIQKYGNRISKAL